LKELEVGHHMSSNFFRKHSQLPLEHFVMCTSYSESFFYNRNEWTSAPTTLTRLALNSTCDILPGLLPPTITHLQVLYLKPSNMDQVAKALPRLKRLDICAEWRDHPTLNHLSKLESLETLNIFIFCSEFEPWHQMLMQLPIIKRTIERGVEVNVATYQDILGAFRGPNMKSAWATYT
jgi:hypothetical protein